MADEFVRLSRRDLLKGAGAAAVAGAVGARALGQEPAAPAGLTKLGPGPVPVDLTFRSSPGQVSRTRVHVEPRVTLLDALRDRIGFTGAKRICDRGACGGCTVLLDGKPVNSCMLLAIECQGREIRVIEQLQQGMDLHPVQAAFVTEDAQQCGFCTPGMVMSCVALLESRPKPTEDEIRRAISGNLCRCGTYPHVIRACQRASR